MTNGTVRPAGALTAQVRRGAARAPLTWRLRNTLRWAFLKGWIAFHWIRPIANWWGLATLIGELRAVKIDGRTGRRTDYGVLGYRMVTTAGCTYMRDDFNNNTGGADITLFNYHGCGTGGGAEAVGNTTLTTECTTALNPDSTRATGAQSAPAATQYKTIGTLTFDADAAVTEHGIFSQAATGGGTLWDKTLFAAINVVGANADSIQFTYTLTLTAGG